VKGKSKLIWPVALMALLLVSPAMRAAATPAAKPAGGDLGHYHFGFEESTKPWTSVADGALSYSLTIASGDNGCADPFGGLINNHYAHLSSDLPIVDARPPVPTTWMVAPLSAGIGEYEVTVEWSARLDNKAPVTSGQGVTAKSCPTCYPVVYVGADAPQAGSQLKIADEKSPLTKSWHNYTYRLPVVTGGKGLVYVALGWNGTGMSIGIDCVDVTMNAIILPPATAH
jgi:hypothetical protein